MPTWNPLTKLFTLRRTIRALDRIGDAIDRQNVLLARLADRFVPVIDPVSPEDLRMSGPSFSRDHEQAAIQTFIERFVSASGREPTEDEVLQFLEEGERTH